MNSIRFQIPANHIAAYANFLLFETILGSSDFDCLGIPQYNKLLSAVQCKGNDYVDINYFIGPTFQRKVCRHNGI